MQIDGHEATSCIKRIYTENNLSISENVQFSTNSVNASVPVEV